MLISDKETFSKSHKATDECFHGVFTHREEENSGAQPRHSQRRDFQAAREKVGRNQIRNFSPSNHPHGDNRTTWELQEPTKAVVFVLFYCDITYCCSGVIAHNLATMS